MSNTLLRTFNEGVQAHIDRSSLVPSRWICRNFTHPKDDRKPWNFKDHEFQIEIVDLGEDVQDAVIIKPAQKGLSTAQIRYILTFLATHDFLKAAYVLPTAGFAREFTQSRLNVAISSSPTINSLVSHETDNTSIKKIGSCFLLMRGTSGVTSAISFDLDLLIVDEVDFCNQNTLSAFSSRLQHSDLNLTRYFSTPTLPGYGVSALYDESSQAERLVKHSSCEKWVGLDFFEHVVIPGFDNPLILYRKEHAVQFASVLSEAYFRCPSCGNPIDPGDLADPSRRQWVHRRPDAWRKGYQVSFWDVPRYSPLVEVLSSIKKYTYSDWVNFQLGRGYESTENSFMKTAVDTNSIVEPVSLYDLEQGRGNQSGSSLFIGVDLGKVAHLTVGVNHLVLDESGILRNELHVICTAQIRVAELPEQHLGKYLFKLFSKNRGLRMVTDAAPDYSVAMYISAMSPEMCFGAEYGLNNTLDIYLWNSAKGIVRIDRDLHFDDLAKAINTGNIKLPVVSSGSKNLVKEHLSVMKKVKETTASGIVKEKWTSTSDEDHYAHSLGYLYAAWASVHDRLNGQRRSYVDPGIRIIKMKV